MPKSKWKDYSFALLKGSSFRVLRKKSDLIVLSLYNELIAPMSHIFSHNLAPSDYTGDCSVQQTSYQNFGIERDLDY